MRACILTQTSPFWKEIHLWENDHVIDIFTIEDMENIPLSIFGISLLHIRIIKQNTNEYWFKMV
jgi:hypothetical protein